VHAVAKVAAAAARQLQCVHVLSISEMIEQMAGPARRVERIRTG